MSNCDGHALYEQGNCGVPLYLSEHRHFCGHARVSVTSFFTRSFVGLSEAFAEPLLQRKKHFPGQLNRVTAFQRKVQPGLIRTEVTNSICILIRYEMEQALLSGELLQRMSHLWAEKYKNTWALRFQTTPGEFGATYALGGAYGTGTNTAAIAEHGLLGTPICASSKKLLSKSGWAVAFGPWGRAKRLQGAYLGCMQW